MTDSLVTHYLQHQIIVFLNVFHTHLPASPKKLIITLFVPKTEALVVQHLQIYVEAALPCQCLSV